MENSVVKGMPSYAKDKIIHEKFGVHKKILTNWIKQRFVRSVKFGDSKQSGRLYNTADVAEVLDRLAINKKPKTKS